MRTRRYSALSSFCPRGQGQLTPAAKLEFSKLAPRSYEGSVGSTCNDSLDHTKAMNAAKQEEPRSRSSTAAGEKAC